MKILFYREVLDKKFERFNITPYESFYHHSCYVNYKSVPVGEYEHGGEHYIQYIHIYPMEEILLLTQDALWLSEEVNKSKERVLIEWVKLVGLWVIEVTFLEDLKSFWKNFEYERLYLSDKPGIDFELDH